MSRRKSILLAFRARLTEITKAKGFRTNAGQHVFLNESPVYGPDDPPEAIAIMAGLETIASRQGEHVIVSLPVNIQAIVQETNLDEPWEIVEDVIADIKQAVELPDRTLGGLTFKTGIERGPTQTLEREPGSEYTGAQVPYVAPFGEVWGHPES